jgi:hypothetical protein
MHHLSCIETHNGVSVVGPKNQTLRIQRNNPVFSTGLAILRGTLPAEQKWMQLQDLVLNPLKAVVDWCERFGLAFTDAGDTLYLNDAPLSRERWLPLFNRMQAAGGSPLHLLQFAEKLGGESRVAQVGKIALHLQDKKLLGLQPALLVKMGLPKDARTGDIVTESSRGEVPFLVSFHEVTAQADGTLLPITGLVLTPVMNESEAADVLAQPVVLGFNRTYRCEEGSSDGWLEDLSFDSLLAARRNAKEIQESGAEARIINRVTGDAVSLR